MGILPHAYQRREDENALSVNWLERVPGDQQTRLKEAAKLIQATQSSGKVGAKARLAVSRVGKFKQTCKANGSKVRIVHEPVEGNEPHSSVRQIPRDDQVLLEAIAREAVEGHYTFGELLKP